MDLIYTSLDGIKRRLKGRLDVDISTSNLPSFAISTGATIADNSLILQIGEQVESEINLYLSQIYELPLQNTHPILTGCAEMWIVGELISIYFIGVQSPEEGSDLNYGAIAIKKAKEKLQALTVSHGVYIPGIQAPQEIPGVSTLQPLVLPGERLKVDNPDTITRNYTITGTRNKPNNGFLSLINWEDKRVVGTEARG